MVDIVVWSTLYTVLATEGQHSACELQGEGGTSAYPREGWFLAKCMHVCSTQIDVLEESYQLHLDWAKELCVVYMLCTIRPTVQSHPLCETNVEYDTYYPHSSLSPV